jgi:hypothetical protein
MDHKWAFFSFRKLRLIEYKLLCSKLVKAIGQRTICTSCKLQRKTWEAEFVNTLERD